MGWLRAVSSANFLAAAFAALLFIHPSLLSAADTREVNNVENLHPTTKFDLTPDLELGPNSKSATYTFDRVYDVGVDSRHRIYVVDNGAARVEMFDSSGTFVRTVGNSGDGPGEYYYASAVAFDAEDNAYIADVRKILAYDKNGGFLREFNHGGGFVRRVRVHDGRVYASNLDLFNQTIIHSFDSQSGTGEGSFCNSYAVGQRVDTRIEMAIAGGTFDIRGNMIYYSQLNPYEIRLFTRDGVLNTTVYRNNDFIEEPIAEVTRDGGLHFEPMGSSTSIVVLSDGSFLNIATIPIDETKRMTVMDLFSSEGVLLTTKRLEGVLLVKCADNANRLYAIDLRHDLNVVRYRVTIK